MSSPLFSPLHNTVHGANTAGPSSIVDNLGHSDDGSAIYTTLSNLNGSGDGDNTVGPGPQLYRDLSSFGQNTPPGKVPLAQIPPQAPRYVEDDRYRLEKLKPGGPDPKHSDSPILTHTMGDYLWVAFNEFTKKPMHNVDEFWT